MVLHHKSLEIHLVQQTLSIHPFILSRQEISTVEIIMYSIYVTWSQVRFSMSSRTKQSCMEAYDPMIMRRARKLFNAYKQLVLRWPVLWSAGPR